MTSELDALRSFRPEAAGPTDDLTLDGRNALMNAIADDSPSRPRPRRAIRFLGRRGVRAVLVPVVALVVVGSVAGAAGLIPADVRDTLGFAGGIEPALKADPDQAMERASAVLTDGSSVELWTAPTDGGGTCVYLRRLDADGNATDGRGVRCEITLSASGNVTATAVMGGDGPGVSSGGMAVGDGSFDANWETGTGRPLTMWGQAPDGATDIVATRPDGNAVTAPVGADGWWVVVAENVPTGASMRLEARTADGKVLGTVRVARPSDAGPSPVPPGTPPFGAPAGG